MALLVGLGGLGSLTGEARAGCSSPGGTTLNCTGDITSDMNLGSLILDSPYNTFNVFDVTNPNPLTVGGFFPGIWVNITSTGVDAELTTDANIDYTGSEDREAIFAQAQDGSVTVVNSGDIIAPDGYAINVRSFELDTPGVSEASLTNYGNISSAPGVRLETEGGGDARFDNYGTVSGNVTFVGSGTNTFNNFFGGTYETWVTVALGPGNTFTNAGTVSPGGTGTIQSTIIVGEYVQSGTGTYTVDVDEDGSPQSDRLNVTGTASFAGAILPNIIALTSETGQLTIATAAALSSTAIAARAGDYDFSLLVDNGTDLVLSWVYAPAPPPPPPSIVSMLINANANQRAIAIYLDALDAAGPNAALQALFDALVDLGETELIGALNQLLPELYSDAQISTLYASQGFAGNLLSCKVNGSGTASIIQEGQCLWAGASASFLSQNTTFSQLGFRERTGSFAAGAQVGLDDNWRLGFGAGYQSTSVDTVTNATSEGNTGQIGVALKYNVGQALVAGTVSGGRAWYDTTRPVAFTGFSGTASSSSSIDFLNGGLRLAYVFGSPQLYFKPVLDAAVTRLDLGGFTETGGGAANLVIGSAKQTVYTITPSLESGTEWWIGNGTLIRPYLRGGVTFYEGKDFALNAGFAGAPTGISPFTINTDMDDVMGVVGVGLDMITAQETVLHVTYDGQFGETTSLQAVALKGSVRY